MVFKSSNKLVFSAEIQLEGQEGLYKYGKSHMTKMSTCLAKLRWKRAYLFTDTMQESRSTKISIVMVRYQRLVKDSGYLGLGFMLLHTFFSSHFIFHLLVFSSV